MDPTATPIIWTGGPQIPAGCAWAMMLGMLGLGLLIAKIGERHAGHR